MLFSVLWPNFLHRRVTSTQRQEWTPDDIRHRDTFVTSILCLTIEKTLKNRIADRTGEVLQNVGTVKGQIAKGKIDELEDILLEWKNLRDDLQKK